MFMLLALSAGWPQPLPADVHDAGPFCCFAKTVPAGVYDAGRFCRYAHDAGPSCWFAADVYDAGSKCFPTNVHDARPFCWLAKMVTS